MEIQHVICYAFSVDKDYKILRIMEMGCIDMMNKYGISNAQNIVNEKFNSEENTTNTDSSNETNETSDENNTTVDETNTTTDDGNTTEENTAE